MKNLKALLFIGIVSLIILLTACFAENESKKACLAFEEKDNACSTYLLGLNKNLPEQLNLKKLTAVITIFPCNNLLSHFSTVLFCSDM